jgi:uncharacterized protein (DUF111 family)
MMTEAQLVLFQVDHLSGEDIGHLIDMLYASGAKNVNVFSSVTKKNRTGHTVLLDLGSGDEKSLGARLADEFGVFGFHLIKTVHCCRPSVSCVRRLSVRNGDRQFEMDIRFKFAGAESDPSYLSVEYEDLVQLKRRIEETFGVAMALKTLRARIEVLFTAGTQLVLEVPLPDRKSQAAAMTGSTHTGAGH